MTLGKSLNLSELSLCISNTGKNSPCSVQLSKDFSQQELRVEKEAPLETDSICGLGILLFWGSDLWGSTTGLFTPEQPSAPSISIS